VTSYINNSLCETSSVTGQL